MIVHYEILGGLGGGGGYEDLLNYEEFRGMTYTVGLVLMCTLRENYGPNLYNLTGVRNRPLPSRPIRGQYLVPML